MSELIESLPLPLKNAEQQFDTWTPTSDLKMVGPTLIGILPDMRVIADYNNSAAIEVLFLFTFMVGDGAMKMATDGLDFWLIMPRGEMTGEGQLMVPDPRNVEYELTTPPEDANMPFTAAKIRKALAAFADEAHGDLTR